MAFVKLKESSFWFCVKMGESWSWLCAMSLGLDVGFMPGWEYRGCAVSAYG